MRSKVLNRVLKNTPEDVKNFVDQYVNLLMMKNKLPAWRRDLLIEMMKLDEESDMYKTNKINNFIKIKPLLDFPNDDSFYFIQLIKRRKENPEMPKSEIVLNTHYITSVKMLERLEKEIIGFCNSFNARAYINLNLRSFKRVGLETLKLISGYIYQEDYKSIRKAYNSCAGKYSSKENQKKWVLDFDYHPTSSDWIINLNGYLFELEPVAEEKIITTIPTRNGVHVITKPFNPRRFKDDYPDVEIHKNNPTILYIP